MNEIWKEIKGYEGFYEISNLGNVKSLERIDALNRILKERVLKPFLSGNKNSQYYAVSLWKNSKRKVITIHKLVAMEFLNHKPNAYKFVVNHIDLNKLNNNLSNLEIVTNRENCNKKHLKSSSKYTGVSMYTASGKWHSRITINGKSIYLGSFKNEIDAHKAYQKEINKIQS